LGISVALVEQPYRVAGRRSPAPAHQLDAAWTAVVERLLADELQGLPLVAGGRSLGARVACRTVEATGALAVLCLAFPLHPPGRPEKSRLSELDAVSVPTLVVQGARDPFGMPPPGLEGAKMLMLVDRGSGKGIGITLFESEEAMRRGDEALNAMNPGTGGQRTSVEFYEVPVHTLG